MARKADKDAVPPHVCACRCPTCGAPAFYYDHTGKHTCSRAACPQGRW